MGNLYAESDMRTNNLQNTFEKKLGTDLVYTQKVNTGFVSKNEFIHDSAGYGLAQWTFWSRKKLLYENTVEKGLSIDDLEGQLETIKQELFSYGLVEKLKECSTLREATKLVLEVYENPADKSDKVLNTRLEYALKYFKDVKDGIIGVDEEEDLLKQLKIKTDELVAIVNKIV